MMQLVPLYSMGFDAYLKVGIYALTPPDPFAWFQRKAPGFNPRACEVKNRFQASAAFQMQLAPLRRGAALHRGGALQVESS